MIKIRETPREKRLNAQRVIFAREYVIDLNPARAALASGLALDEESALQRGRDLLTQPRVKPLIHYLMQNRAQRLDINADKIVQELARIAFSNFLDYMTPDDQGEMRVDFSKLTRDTAAAIQEIREDATGGSGDGERKLIVRTTFKLADKLRALELLAKHLGILQERVRVDVNVSISDKLEQARKRVASVTEIKCLPQKIAS